MYTLSTWYTKDETTQHIVVFFLGMFGGTAISPLLASALMKLEGKRGLSGWQWIFLGMFREFLTRVRSLIPAVEGLWSIVISIMLLVFLPERNDIRQTAMHDSNEDDEKQVSQ